MTVHNKEIWTTSQKNLVDYTAFFSIPKGLEICLKASELFLVRQEIPWFKSNGALTHIVQINSTKINAAAPFALNSVL